MDSCNIHSQNGSAPADSINDCASKGLRSAKITLLTNILLTVVKILAGILGNSYALIADGVESGLDVFSSIIVWGSIKLAAKPPDAGHPYGHGRAEPLGGLAVSIMLIVAAVGIAVQSVQEIVTPKNAPAPFTLIVLLAVVITKESLFRYLAKTGETIGSRAVTNDAWHQRSDALTSVAAFIGISIALIGGEGYESADGFAALFASVIIFYNGIRLSISALDDVMDKAIPSETKSQIRKLAGSISGVSLIEKCRVRKAGFSLFVDIHVMVDGEITVKEGHNIAHRVKDALVHSELRITDVLVHIEPVEEEE